MKKTIKKYFIPHAANNYHPHILHGKRFFWYTALAAAIKVMVVVFVLLLPEEAFLMPEILAVQQDKVIALTNEFRKKSGLPELKENIRLFSSSGAKAEDMAREQYFSHQSPKGKTLSFFLDQAGYQYRVAGENLAVGYFDAQETVEAWKASPTHRANLLDKDFTEIGVGARRGVFEGASSVFLAQHFGQPKNLVENPALALNNENTIPLKEAPAIYVAGQKISPASKYILANHTLAEIEPIFGFSKMIYLSLIVFFTLVLALNVLVEIRRQKAHVIIRTLALLGVLFGFWLV